MIPLVDLKKQHAALLPRYRQLFDEVVQSGQFVLGPYTEACERKLAAYCQIKHVIGLSSGTDALIASLMALHIGSGDEVITTPFTFFATAGCVARLGARPVFVDIDRTTFNLDVTQIESAITPRTRAIIPVHLFGQCADMQAIMTIARQHRLKVIEDAAQAVGARDGTVRAGSMGDVGCLSFYPTKNLPAMGDAGACTTGDDELADRITSLRVHGQDGPNTHRYVGGNFRIDALQAAMLTVMLEPLDDWTAARRKQARRYRPLLEGLPLILPEEGPGKFHVYNCYTVRVPEGRREELRTFLKERGISTRAYYALPLHLQPCLAHLGYGKGDFPVTEEAAEQVLSLPIFPDLSEQQQATVAETIRDFYR